MRLFIAIPLPADWCDILASQDLSSIQGKGIRRIASHHLHVTQLFLGEVDDWQSVANVCKHLSLPSFNLTDPKFKIASNRRMLWLGFQPHKTFSHNAHLLSKALDIPLPNHQVLIPHITLLRARRLINKQPLPTVPPRLMNRLKVKYYEIWQSQLTKQGAYYSNLDKIPLT